MTTTTTHYPLGASSDEFWLHELPELRDECCPCDPDYLWFGGETVPHDAHHEAWELGRAWPGPDGVAWVRPSSPLAERAALWDSNRAWARSCGYDVNIVGYPTDTGDPADRTSAVVLVRDGRVAGHATLYEGRRSFAYWMDLADGEVEQIGVAPRFTVTSVFVPHALRGTGTAVELAEAVARTTGSETWELTWVGPFTVEGLGLAARFSRDGRVPVCL